ncbi:MAG: hypothetical protein KatS3mg057_0340 [Herpetosiphonaceae bacterium]|nr:MAG: hypothetical protein KatS3mg057_0340 [Herpetosiphonaceae bacterium]
MSTTSRPQPSRRASLNRRLVGLLLTVGLLPLLAIAVITNLQSRSTLTHEAQSQLMELAASSSDKLDRILASRFGDTHAFASSDAARVMDPLRIIPFMARMTQIYAPHYRLMLVADREGRIIAASSARPDGQFLDGASLIGQSVRGERWFEVWRERELKPGTTYVEDVHVDQRVARLYGDAGYVIGLSHGIFDHTGTWVGVWLSLFDWNTAHQTLQEFEQRPHEQGQRSVRLLIVNKDGLILAGSGPDNILRTHYGDLVNADVIVGEAASQGYGKFSGLGWKVIAIQDRDEALLVVRQLTQRILLVAALSSVVVAILGITAARSITSRVRALQTASERVAAGDLQVQAPVGNDELGQLGYAFNSMTSELRNLYTSLEEKVAQRTSELEATLIDLQRSSADLEVSKAQLSEANLTLAHSEARYRQLFEHTQAMLAETQILYRTARSLIRSESLSDLLQAVVDSVAQALSADAVALITFDVTARQVTNFVIGGPGVSRIKITSFEELWNGLSGWVLREQQPALSPKGTPDPRESPEIQRSRAEMRNGSIIVVPLRYRDQILGTMTAINSIDQPDFTQSDVDLMMALANQATIAIENARLLEDAQRRAREAETLREVGAVVAATLSQEEAIERILEQLGRVIPYDSASVQMLRDGYLEIVGGRGWSDLGEVVGIRFPIPGDNPNTIVVQQRQPYILDNAPTVYSGFANEYSTSIHVRSWLGIPLIVHDRVIGMLAVDKAQPGYFTADHARLAAAFADHVAITIENARLYTAAKRELAERKRAEEELRRSQEHLEDLVEERTAELKQLAAELSEKNRRLRHGVELAREIQLGLLPDRAPWESRYLAIHARSIPTSEVGGDFYTFVPSGEQHLGMIAIGDISGKGVGAALMMALVSSALENQGREVFDPARLLSTLNEQLAPRLKTNRMNAALAVAHFDLLQRTLRVANAGMIAPLLLRDGRVEFIEAYGLPLGSLSNIHYYETQVDLQPGDLIVLVSDGVVEAHNGSRELFGFERLIGILGRHGAATRLDHLIDEIIVQVAKFTGSAEQHDDITIIAIRPNLEAFDHQ